MPRSIAGWAQANISARRRSGIHLALPASGLDLVGDQLHVLLPRGAGLASPDGVGLPPAGDGQQPGVRIVRHAVDRPRPQRRREGLAERILGARHVARAGGEEGDEAAVAFARHALGGTAGLVGMAHFQLPCGFDDRTDLDRAVLARGAALGPGDRLVEVGHVDEEVAGELLLGVGIRAVEHFGLAVAWRTVVAAALGCSRSPEAMPPPALPRASLKAPYSAQSSFWGAAARAASSWWISIM